MGVDGDISQRLTGVLSRNYRTSISGLAFYGILFLVSGSAGLIYQVVWEKLLQLYFGVTTFSVTLIVAAFMCGLGLGSLWGGHYSRKVKSTLVMYGVLEIGIALFGLASPNLLIWVGNFTAGSSYAIVFLLSFVLLLIPTFLMGATLPFLSQAFVRRVETSGRVIGILYGINTFGAAAGALISGYLLIGWAGLKGASNIAVALNAVVGLAALLLARKSSLAVTANSHSNQEQTKAVQSPWGYSTILFAAFLTGFLGLGYEMLWIRVLNIVNKHSVYNFPTVLFIFLSALALGGYIFGKTADRSPRPVELFWRVELLVGIVAAASFLFFWLALDYGPIQSKFEALFTVFQRPVSPYNWVGNQLFIAKRRALIDLFIFLLPPLLLILPAGLLMGGGLPILDRIAIESPRMAGRRVGDIHLANIAGSVLGTLLVSLVFLPRLGTELTLKVLVSGSLVFFLLFLKSQRNRIELKQMVNPGWVLPVGTLLMLILLPGKSAFYEKIFQTGTRSTVYLNEGRDGVLAFSGVTANQPPELLWIGGEVNSFFPPNGVYESRALACSGATRPRRILIIGLGGGNSAYFFTKNPDIQEIIIVELLQNLTPFLELHLDHVKTMLSDTRVKVITDDGRRYLYANQAEKFDLIATDPLRNFTVGHNNLYSKEAMTLYRDHLSENGILCAWTDEYNILPLTTASVFPYVDDYNDFMIASNQAIRYDLQYMQEISQLYLSGSPAFYAPGTEDLLMPENVLSRFIRDREQILPEERGKPLLSDLKPRLEYYYFPIPLAPAPRQRGPSLAAFASRVDGCDDRCLAKILAK